jgi:hypothetical protein
MVYKNIKNTEVNQTAISRQGVQIEDNVSKIYHTEWVNDTPVVTVIM